MKLWITSIFITWACAFSETIRGGEGGNATKGSRELLFDNLEPRIIGGSESARGRFSYSISIQDIKGHFCGGSLVAVDMVLTAAHCTGGDYNIVIGKHNLFEKGGDVVGKKSEIIHPKYNDNLADNDFALVILERPTTADVELINLNSKALVPGDNDPVTVMGWGDVDKSDVIQKLPPVMNDVEVNVVSNPDCEKSEGFVGIFAESFKGAITKNMLCAWGRNQDACQGDSGGPLVILGKDQKGADDIQVGIVSWGLSCAHPDFPGVYSRISAAYGWIEDEVCKQSKSPPSSFNCGGGSAGNFGNGGNGDNNIGSSGSGSNGKWKTLATENFERGYGIFKSNHKLTRHRSSTKNRKGVLNIQKTSKASTKVIPLRASYSKVRVTFSFFSRGMESDDKFCLDNKKSGQWEQFKCWSTPRHFQNKKWYDNVKAEFSVGSKDRSVTIQFRCVGDNIKDDVLIDKVVIEAA